MNIYWKIKEKEINSGKREKIKSESKPRIIQTSKTMQDDFKRDMQDLKKSIDRGFELCSDTREILDKGVSEEMKNKIKSEEIKIDKV